MNGKISHVNGFKELILNKMPILSKAIFRFNTMASFTEEKKKKCNNLYRTQKVPNSQSNLDKEE